MMMMATLSRLAQMRYTLLLGAVVGVFIGGGFSPLIQAGFQAYDEAHPVIVLKAEVEKATAEDVLIRIAGSKERTCQYIRLQAYMVLPGGILADAAIRRVDVAEDGDTKPIGNFNMGVWRIWPRDGATAVQVYAQHLCGGRLVVSKVVDVELPK